SFAVTINAAPTLGALSATSGNYSTAFNATIPINGGTAPFNSGSLSVSNLPPGLTASLSGTSITLSGPPTSAGNFNAITASVTDAAGVVVSSVTPYAINIQTAQTSTVVSSMPAPWAVGQPATFAATVATNNQGTPVGTVVFTIVDNTHSSTFQT